VAPGSIDQAHLDAVFQATLALAGEADDWKERELGPLHLLKYAYLADLAFAEQNDGATFTGVPWRFHHFGPWSEQAHARIDFAAKAVDAERRNFVGDYGESARYKAGPGLLEQVAARLPHPVIAALRRAVREFGNDTYDLLNHVYLTEPMRNAAPGETLVFSAAPPAEDVRALEAPAGPLSTKAKRLRQAKLDAIRQEMRLRLSRPREGRMAMPAPRYDEVFERGSAWIDTLAGEPVPQGTMEAVIGEEMWKSESRREHAD